MRSYIFDLDGTLLDSMGVWNRIDQQFLQKRGFAVPPDYVQAISHLRFSEVARYTIERFGLGETPEQIMAEWQEMALWEYGNKVSIKPGGKEYLLALREKGTKLAVATSLTAPLREAALAHHGITGLFDVICSTDEVERGKEFPDLFLYTARLLDADPADCIVFEDILPAVRSAKAAGMTVYAVYDETSQSCWEEIAFTADSVIYDFADAPLPE